MVWPVNGEQYTLSKERDASIGESVEPRPNL